MAMTIGRSRPPNPHVYLHRATTHTDLELRARDLGIPVKIIHNASIMNAVGVCGLQLYRFGEVSQPHGQTCCTSRRALLSATTPFLVPVCLALLTSAASSVRAVELMPALTGCPRPFRWCSSPTLGARTASTAAWPPTARGGCTPWCCWTSRSGSRRSSPWRAASPSMSHLGVFPLQGPSDRSLRMEPGKSVLCAVILGMGRGSVHCAGS